MEILGLSLMSIAALMYGVVPVFADFNRTHAGNRRWTSHARFHVVTQVLTTSAVAAISLWLLWSPKVDRDLGVCIAAALGGAVIGGFFVSAAFSRLYGGTLSDEQGGIPRAGGVDLNALNFGSAALILIAGRLALL